MEELFQENHLIAPFLEKIHQEKPRYYRDQLGVIRKLFEKWDLEMILKGLQYCTEKELYSAVDLKASILYLSQIKTDKKAIERSTALPAKYRGNAPEVRNLRIYDQAMERGVVNG